MPREHPQQANSPMQRLLQLRYSSPPWRPWPDRTAKCSRTFVDREVNKKGPIGRRANQVAWQRLADQSYSLSTITPPMGLLRARRSQYLRPKDKTFCMQAEQFLRVCDIYV